MWLVPFGSRWAFFWRPSWEFPACCWRHRAESPGSGITPWSVHSCDVTKMAGGVTSYGCHVTVAASWFMTSSWSNLKHTDRGNYNQIDTALSSVELLKFLNFFVVFLSSCFYLFKITALENTKRWPNAGWMLGQRCRRWSRIQPAFSQCIACCSPSDKGRSRISIKGVRRDLQMFLSQI